MKKIYPLVLKLLIAFIFCISVSSGYAYDLVVAQDGTGNFTTVQAAINAAPANSSTPYTILIKNGKYREKVNVPSNKVFLQLTGESVGGVFIYYDDPATILGTQNSASFTINANDFTAVNITFANTFNYDSASAAGQQGLQAVAVVVNADRVAFSNCRFLGNQDTLYTKGSGTPRHYFRNCYIDGIIDFIFGSSVAVFDSCVVYAKARTIAGSSFITAANTPSGQTYGYVFRNCRFPANNGSTTYYLGRPWQNSTGSNPFAENKVSVLSSRLSDKIRPEGWVTWDAGTNTNLITYNEYNSKYFNGALVDVSQRVTWSSQLTSTQASTYTLATIFNGWDPTLLPGFNTSAAPNLVISNFIGTKGNPNSTFTWNISWPLDQVKYELFRSTTTKTGTYSKISEVISTNDTAINFSLTDANPPSGSIYYYYILASKTGLANGISDTVQISSAPTINVAAALSSFYQTIGAPSPTQTYTVSGTDLQGNVTITPPASFEISNNGGTNWYNNSTPLTLTQSGGTLATTTITIRLNASVANSYSGNVVHVSTNATTYNLAVTGTAVTAPAINSAIVQQWPFTLNANDSANTRSPYLTASTPTFKNLYVSNGTTLATIPAYSATYGQAFGASSNGDGTWSTAVGGPGGNLSRIHYEQFTVTANGRSVRLDSIMLSAAFYNTSSSTKLAIVYSKSGFTSNDSTDVTGGVDQSGASVVGSFASPITLANQTGGPTNFYRLALNGSTGVTLASGETVSIRLYFSCSSTGTPRYAMVKNVIVKGEALSPFPLTLLNFNGSYNGTDVNLLWKTANEVNAAMFVIEKSLNATEFNTLGKVDAKNISNASYEFADAHPANGVNYYRLKMIDKDGSYKYSSVVAININSKQGINIYPNPVKNILALTHSKAGQNATIEIYSTDLKRILAFSVQPASVQTSINVANLAEGNYLIIYSDGVNKTASKFIKQ